MNAANDPPPRLVRILPAARPLFLPRELVLSVIVRLLWQREASQI
jgi:hypothetical protein